MMRKILVVEDEPDSRLLLRRRLEANRFAVLEAQDGYDALRKSKESRPDVIVLDLKMPEIDGIQVYERLRGDPETRAIPVIFLTGIGSGSFLTEQSVSLIASTKHGVDLSGPYAVLTKPYDAQELVKKIQEMLGP